MRRRRGSSFGFAVPGLVALVLAFVVGGCAATGPAATGSAPTGPGGSGADASGPVPTRPGATRSPSSAGVTNADEAMATVRARSPLFDGIQHKDPNRVGQASWWDAQPAANGWLVTVEVGWGDCQAGCIDRHTWTWTVAGDGSTTFGGEQGTALRDDILAGLQDASTAQGIGGWAAAGPTCPVERPGDPACGPRMVDASTLVVADQGGKEVARFTTDGSGLFRIPLEPGEYTVQAQPVGGLMGTPGPATAEVQAGSEAWVELDYDTGIR